MAFHPSPFHKIRLDELHFICSLSHFISDSDFFSHVLIFSILWLYILLSANLPTKSIASDQPEFVLFLAIGSCIGFFVVRLSSCESTRISFDFFMKIGRINTKRLNRRADWEKSEREIYRLAFRTRFLFRHSILRLFCHLFWFYSFFFIICPER